MRTGALLLALVVVTLVGCGSSSSTTSIGSGPHTQLVYQATPTDPSAPFGPAIDHAVGIMRARLAAVHLAGDVTRRENDVVVDLPGAPDPSAEKLVGTTARVEFYDWEANALLPTGKTVASQLQTQNSTALQVSQGSQSGPGTAGAGSIPLYQAVLLASKQPSRVSSDNSRVRPQYYMFGAPGSAACATAAREQGKALVAGVHCLLSGPDESRHDLLSGLPNRVTASERGVQTLVVPQGTVVLEAVPQTIPNWPAIGDPTAQFYVLQDHVALFGNDITNPQQSTDQSGNPEVSFGFTPHGGSAFQRVTAQIASRGDLVSGLGQKYFQHFAVALDNQLITVPSIDYTQYPNGIPPTNGAEITGGFTINSAQDLATQLRLGALPVQLRLISVKY